MYLVSCKLTRNLSLSTTSGIPKVGFLRQSQSRRDMLTRILYVGKFASSRPVELTEKTYSRRMLDQGSRLNKCHRHFDSAHNATMKVLLPYGMLFARERVGSGAIWILDTARVLMCAEELEGWPELHGHLSSRQRAMGDSHQPRLAATLLQLIFPSLQIRVMPTSKRATGVHYVTSST